MLKQYKKTINWDNSIFKSYTTIQLSIICSFILNFSPLFSNRDVKNNDPNLDMGKRLKLIEELKFSDLVEATTMATTIRLEAIKLEDNHHYCQSTLILGDIYRFQGYYALALETYLDLEGNVEKEDLEIQAHYNLALAMVFRFVNKHETSSEKASYALNLYEQLGDSVYIANSYNVLGLIHYDKKEYPEADKYFKLALAINRNIDNKRGIAKNLNNLSMTPGDEERKVGMIREAIKYNTSMGKQWSLAENYNNLANLFLVKGDLAACDIHLKLAYSIAEPLNARQLICDNYTYRMQLAALEKEYEKAYKYALMIAELEKELHSINTIMELEQRAIRNSYSQQTQELKLEKEQNKNERLQKIILSISLLFIVTLLILLIFRIKKAHRSKLEKLIEQSSIEIKNKEMLRKKLEEAEISKTEISDELNNASTNLTELSYYVKSRNILFDKIIEELNNIYPTVSDKSRISLKYIESFIKQYRNKEKEIMRFSQQVEEYDKLFTQRLLTRHPELTKKELQLATLLRLRLSSKEIAFLLNSTEKNVTMARYRFRKHIELVNDENLVDYISSI